MVVQILHGDALEKLPEIEEEVDLCITDPPYNISVDDAPNWRRTCEDASPIERDFGEWDKAQLDYAKWIPLVYDSLSEVGVLATFYDYQELSHLSEFVVELGMDFRQPFVWWKTNAPPQIAGVKWREAAEMGIIATMNEGMGHHYQTSEGQRDNVISAQSPRGGKRFNHPTQKPIKVMKAIIKWWSEPGDTILDPFAGTGTVGEAAAQLGRDCILIEKDKEWIDIINERVSSIGTDALDW